MTKKFFYSLVFLSLFVHLWFICSYPLTADELNIFNIFNFHSPDFSTFWKYFNQYDTHQPLFYVMWYPWFSNTLPAFILRLPSLLMFLGAICVWSKLFRIDEKRNLVPWLLFLFCPFVIIYSSLFLPYSLLIFCSLLNFYYFEKIERVVIKKELYYFLISSILLIFTHYYGALQVVLLCGYLIYKNRNKRIMVFLISATIALMIMLFAATDFINDFGAVHKYRKVPNIVEILGEINLLLGGIFSTFILLSLILIKKKWIILKSKESVFVVVVISIAFLKSVLISPSLEARYLLILVYPLYFLFRETQFKFISPILIIAYLIALYILENKFSPSFVIDYSDIKKNENLTALVITPCPKYYFMEENYRCTGLIDGERLWRAFDAALIHADHIDFMKKAAPELRCKLQKKGLYFCTVPTFHF